MTFSSDPLDWWLALAALGIWLGLILDGRMRAGRRAAALAPAGGGAGALLVAYASQGGRAEEIARAEAALRGGSGPVLLLPLDRVGEAELSAARQAVFVISTTGDGDAPDNAERFLARMMAAPAALGGLAYGLLALGDRSYPSFCGFGRRFDHWLQQSLARPLFPRVELDREDGAALGRWQAALEDSLGPATGPVSGVDGGDGLPAGFAHWTLRARQLLNPGSPGAGLYRLQLDPAPGAEPDWLPGDLAVLRIPGPDGRHLIRDYSLASLAQSGRAELLVRLQSDAAGVPGPGSGWLTGTAPGALSEYPAVPGAEATAGAPGGLAEGGSVQLRIRRGPGFPAAPDAAPLVLIGAGSGLAGLLPHLRHRAALRARGASTGPVWLLFGERSPEHDRPFDSALQGWLRDGVLSRLDRCFSRGPGGPRHVQHLLEVQPDTLRSWIADGAHLLVCGSRQGMGEGVGRVLETLLGAPGLAALERGGRIRREVY